MSDIKVNCPHCKQSLEVPEEMLGTIADCPSCAGQIQLPSRQVQAHINTPRQQIRSPQPKQDVVQPPLQKVPVEPPLVQTSQQAKLPKTMVFIVATLVVLVLVLFAVVVILLYRQGTSQNESAVKSISTQSGSPSSNVGQISKPKHESFASSEPKVQKKGKVVVTVTWQYNKYVGTKPDTGATVILIPKTYKQKLKVDYVNLDLWAGVAVKEQLSQDGIFIETVNGQGRAVFNRVPVGQYTCAIQSKNTKAYQERAELTVNIMKYYFECNGFGTEVYSKIIENFKTKDVTVDEGDEIEVSHDFGNTDV